MGKEFDMVNKLGRRHNLEPKLIPWGEFSWKPLLTGLVFLCFFQYFVYIAHFTKFTRRSSLLCRFVVLLLSTFYSFSIFAAGFTFAFLQLCPLLCRPPQRSNERSR